MAQSTGEEKAPAYRSCEPFHLCAITTHQPHNSALPPAAHRQLPEEVLVACLNTARSTRVLQKAEFKHAARCSAQVWRNDRRKAAEVTGRKDLTSGQAHFECHSFLDHFLTGHNIFSCSVSFYIVPCLLFTVFWPHVRIYSAAVAIPLAELRLLIMVVTPFITIKLCQELTWVSIYWWKSI